ncbi:hypothetical protein Tco_1560966 [Tanacetum coccineum]
MPSDTYSVQALSGGVTPTRSVLTLKPLPKIEPKDKGKGVLEEEPEPAKKLKKSDFDAAQLAMDKEYAKQVNAKLQTGLERERFAAEEATQLKGTKKSIQDFVPIGSAEDERLLEKMNKQAAGEDTSKKEKVLEEPDSTKMEVKQKEVEESTRKRPSTILKMKARKKARKQTHVDSDASKKKKGSPRMKRMSKRKKTDSDLEEEEHLKTFLKIVPDEEGIINYERFTTTTPEGVDLVLWGDLRTMFDANAEDKL